MGGYTATAEWTAGTGAHPKEKIDNFREKDYSKYITSYIIQIGKTVERLRRKTLEPVKW